MSVSPSYLLTQVKILLRMLKMEDSKESNMFKALNRQAVSLFLLSTSLVDIIV